MRIDALEVDDEILDKIESKHGVTFEEVEDACFSSHRHLRRGREGLYQLFGQTDDGRYLFVVLAALGGGAWKVVTARGMTERERGLFQQHRGTR
ncbi:MAG: BrnT family toxin [Chloroflexi bacterium]|nr:BrnT family toxin [Chloroflexota bacterium]